jgi:hypothetical protein
MLTAWKDLERRIARALGGTRTGPRGRAVSDVEGTPFSVECKRTASSTGGIRGSWVVQARLQGKKEGKPWLLVVSGHNDRRPIVVMDFWAFAEIAQQAELIPTPLLVEEEVA